VAKKQNNDITPRQKSALPSEVFDQELYEAFQAAREGLANAGQLADLEGHVWVVFDQKTHAIEELSFEQLQARGNAWDKVVNAPWLFPIGGEAKPARVRDRMAEHFASTQKRAKTLVSLRNQRLDGTADWKDLIYISRYLVAMSLPYDPTTERQIVKSARLGDGSRVHLQLTANIAGIDLPYGSDRTLLHWLLDQIARQLQVAKAAGDDDQQSLEQARFVRWTKASDYLREMGMAANSGKNYSDLRGRYRRLAGLSIGLRIEAPGGETLHNIPLIESAHLPTSVDVQAEQQGQQRLDLESDDLTFGVLFSKKLVATLMSSAVPFPREILRKTRKQSQMQDYWLFLAWRSFSAKKPSLIPWEEVREQLWQQDQTIRRIKGRFREAIKALQLIWPELKAESREKGLWIAPPRGGVQLIDRGTDLKRLATTPEDETALPGTHEPKKPL